MTWTAPMTFVPNSVLTASQLNIFLRDNMQETMPAKATTAGRFFVTVDQNQIEERAIGGGSVATSETTTSLEYINLATVGPAVTVTTRTRALVMMYCNMSNSSGTAAWMSYAVSGATETDASDNRAIMMQLNGGQRLGVAILHESLNPGSNTFTAAYRVTLSGTGTFSDRRIAVIPF